MQKLEPQPLGEHPHAQRQQAKTTRENAGKLRSDAIEVGGSFIALADLLDEFKRDCGSETLQMDIVAIRICVEFKSKPLSNLLSGHFNTLHFGRQDNAAACSGPRHVPEQLFKAALVNVVDKKHESILG